MISKSVHPLTKLPEEVEEVATAVAAALGTQQRPVASEQQASAPSTNQPEEVEEIITSGAAALELQQRPVPSAPSTLSNVRLTALWELPSDRQLAMLRDADLGAMGFSEQNSPQEKQLQLHYVCFRLISPLRSTRLKRC